MQKLLTTIVLFLFFPVVGDDVSYPNAPDFKLYADKNSGVAIKFPSAWSVESAIRNEVFLSKGEIRGLTGACFVRLSTVKNLHLLKSVDYFSRSSEKDFIQQSSMSMPDIKIHRFDMAYLGGKDSRRIIYSGTDSGIKTGTVIYQALDGDNIFTVGCLSNVANFNLLYNDFEIVISSFKFK